MLDLLFVLLGLGFFVVAILYTYGCDWLIKDQQTIPVGERVETTGERAGHQTT